MKTIWMLVSAALALSAISLAQAISQESPFACDRSALTAADRKRHFDELGPTLRGMVKNVRELPDGYEFQFPADPIKPQNPAPTLSRDTDHWLLELGHDSEEIAGLRSEGVI